MKSQQNGPISPPIRLRVEFALLFFVAPAVMAVAVPPGWLFPVLGVFSLLSILLLLATPGFHLQELLEGWRRVSLRLVLSVAVVTAAVGSAIVLATAPGSFLGLVRGNPGLMLMIAALYPLVSALPQELVYRALFFRRYASILPDRAGPAVLLNAAVFSFAHLMYWSWIVLGMTFAGGLLFAWSHRVRRNFPEAVVVHAVAGIVLFAVGMGAYFYSGNVRRPF